MDTYFQPLICKTEAVGQSFKSSKKLFSWTFKISQEEHKIDLECSFLTNKRRVYVNSLIEYEGRKTMGKNFSYKVYMGNHVVLIENKGTDADLIVDGQSFNAVYSKRIWDRMYSNQKANPDARVETEPIDPFKERPQFEIGNDFLEVSDEETPAKAPQVDLLDLLSDAGSGNPQKINNEAQDKQNLLNLI